MRTCITKVLFLGLLAVFMVGCAKREEKLFKQKMGLLDKVIDTFDKVTDKASFDSAQPTLADLNGKMAEIDQELRASPAGETVIAANKAQLDSAMARLKTAKAKAAKAAFNIP